MVEAAPLHGQLGSCGNWLSHSSGATIDAQENGNGAEDDQDATGDEAAISHTLLPHLSPPIGAASVNVRVSHCWGG
jgi:hypothetical protein